MSFNKKYDYIVVGQGLAGTLLVHDLLERNKSILIVDVPLRASASRVAAGLINPISVRRCIPAFPDFYLKTAIKRYQELEEKLSSSFLHLKPILKLFRNEDVKHLWNDKYSNEGMDIYIKSFNKKNTFPQLNDAFTSANVEPAGNLDVVKFLYDSKEYFTDKCDLLDEKFDFDSFNNTNINYKDYDAQKIIFCEGYRVSENPFFSYLPIAPTKGEVITIKIPSIKYFDRIISKGVYVLPLGNHLYTVGATYNREDLTDKITGDGQQFLKDRLEGILNVEYEILDRVAGVRPTVKDYKSLIGWHPENNNIGIFNGLGARGVLAGPYLSNAFINSDFENISRFSK